MNWVILTVIMKIVELSGCMGSEGNSFRLSYEICESVQSRWRSLFASGLELEMKGGKDPNMMTATR